MIYDDIASVHIDGIARNPKSQVLVDTNNVVDFYRWNSYKMIKSDPNSFFLFSTDCMFRLIARSYD